MELFVRVFAICLLAVSVSAQLPSQDILALLEFKKGITLDPTGYILDSWNEESIDFNGCPSSWNGIVCSGANVAAVVLDNLDISADADIGVFTNLTMLLKLSMANNSIAGVIPSNVGDFKSLKYLDVSNNLFSGGLPEGIGRIRRLQNLSLAANNLTGPIPKSIAGLGSILSLDLSRNSFSGSLPSALTRLKSLVTLNLSFNKFVRRIPTALERLSNLKFLDLSWNRLDGGIDWTFLMRSRVVHVDLSGNSLISLSAKELKFLSDISATVKYLNLSNNRLTGSLIDGGKLSTFGSLEVLDLSYNQLSGELPGFNYVYDLEVLRLGNNGFSGFLPDGLLKGDSLALTELDLSANNLSGVIPANLRKFPDSSFHPGNPRLVLPSGRSNSSGNSRSELSNKKPMSTVIKAVVTVSSVVALVVLILIAIIVHYKRISNDKMSDSGTNKTDNKRSFLGSSGIKGRDASGHLVVSADELVAPHRSLDEKRVAASGFSPSKTSSFSCSPEWGDSCMADNFGRLDVRSPDRLAGDLCFLDDAIGLTAGELSRAPAEVLGRSSHGTSYRATLDNGVFLTVKWLREGVAKPKRDFSKEVKKFANIRHPNVVGLRGYYWGPTPHEKLILSDHISPGSLASFLYDRPGRKGPPLTWVQRLKIAVDVARGLNYLHFDRALPHGNLKATNILLDGLDLNARVSDYCLHRLMTQAGTVEQVLDSGVLGYRAPELAASKKPSPSFKTDVYAFGVVLLELLTGRCAGDVVSGEEGGVDLTDWVRLRVAEGRGSDCFDQSITSETSNIATPKGTEEVLGIALRCIRPVSGRPGIKSVYEDLSSI